MSWHAFPRSVGYWERWSLTKHGTKVLNAETISTNLSLMIITSWHINQNVKTESQKYFCQRVLVIARMAESAYLQCFAECSAEEPVYTQYMQHYTIKYNTSVRAEQPVYHAPSAWPTPLFCFCYRNLNSYWYLYLHLYLRLYLHLYLHSYLRLYLCLYLC